MSANDWAACSHGCPAVWTAVGATVEFLPKFSAAAVWDRLSLRVGDAFERPWITVLMGVPTVYAQLIEEYERMGSSDAASPNAFWLFWLRQTNAERCWGCRRRRGRGARRFG
eukprot:COSAG04_NODE_293_length_17799_cov_1173.430904_6_plen_112_part_00